MFCGTLKVFYMLLITETFNTFGASFVVHFRGFSEPLYINAFLFLGRHIFRDMKNDFWTKVQFC